MASLQYYCIPGLAGTRSNKSLCAKDAGCAGNKITVITRSNVPKGHGEHGSTPPTFLCIKKKKFLFLTIMDFFKKDHLVPL